jgi:hypothetical protein
MAMDCKTEIMKQLDGPELKREGWAKYLTSAVGADGNIYSLPTTAKRILKINVKTEEVELLGEDLHAKYGMSSDNGLFFGA